MKSTQCLVTGLEPAATRTGKYTGAAPSATRQAAEAANLERR